MPYMINMYVLICLLYAFMPLNAYWTSPTGPLMALTGFERPLSANTVNSMREFWALDTEPAGDGTKGRRGACFLTVPTTAFYNSLKKKCHTSGVQTLHNAVRYINHDLWLFLLLLLLWSCTTWCSTWRQNKLICNDTILNCLSYLIFISSLWVLQTVLHKNVPAEHRFRIKGPIVRKQH